MGKGWVVPQASALALVLVLAGQALGQPTSWPQVALGLVLALGGAFWAYAIADASYGSKAALVACLVYAIAGGGLAAAVWEDNPNVLPTRIFGIVGTLLCIAALVAGAVELRTRRGRVSWTSVAALSIPALILLARVVAALLQPPIY